MDISESTGALKPGEKYLFLSPELANKGLTEQQLGVPEIDGVVVNYRGVDIISIEEGRNTFLWSAGGYGTEKNLRDMINRIQATMTPKSEDPAWQELLVKI